MENIKQISDSEISSIAEYLYNNGGINKNIIRAYLHNRIISYTRILKYNSILEVIDLVVKTLIKYGYSKEEAYKFINNNKGILVESIDELKLKFSLLHSINLLHYVLINKPTQLFCSSILTARRLYSFMVYLKLKNMECNYKNIFSIKYDYRFYDRLTRSYVLRETEKDNYIREFEDFINNQYCLNLKESN